jgi:hypothetical protein
MFKKIYIVLFLAIIGVISSLEADRVRSMDVDKYPTPIVGGGFAQENTNQSNGLGIKSHWNLTDIISSTANAFDTITYDVNGDGDLEIIVSKNARCEFYCLKSDGAILWKTPVLSHRSPGYYGGQVVDLDGDGKLEYVIAADDIWVLSVASGEIKWHVPEVGLYPEEAPWVLGKVSPDCCWDIIVARAHEGDFVISVYNAYGDLVWRHEIEDAIYGHTLSVQDVDDDGYDEIFVACSKRTVALDHDGKTLWSAPLASDGSEFTAQLAARHDFLDMFYPLEDWWYHSDFVEVVDLYNTGKYYVLHDWGGGIVDPTTVQVLEALTGDVVGEFHDTGHIQWLDTDDFHPQLKGHEIVYVTRDRVVMRDSNLDLIWEKALSGAHHLGIGDWEGDGFPDVIVSSIFRGVNRFAGADSNFVVYNRFGDIIYNMLFEYLDGGGYYASAEMQSAMRGLNDYDGDGRIDVPVSFSNHDVGKFGSSRDVHQYILGYTDPDYQNQFLNWGNESSSVFDHTMMIDNSLQLSYALPTEEYTQTMNTVLLMHLNEGEGNIAIDSSSYGNHGYLQNVDWSGEGKFGPALEFANIDTSLLVPNSEYLNLGRMVIDAWIDVSPYTETQTIIEKNGSFSFQINPEGALRFSIWDMNAQKDKTPEVKAPFTNFGELAHVMAIYDGAFLRLVVNGKQLAIEGHVGKIHDSQEDVYIGNGNDGLKPLQGIIDELRISTIDQNLPRIQSGTWVSEPIYPLGQSSRFGTFYFSQSLNSGYISYTFLNLDGEPLLGHEDIISSPHSMIDMTEPVQVRAFLERSHVPFSSPQIDSIRFTWGISVYLPLVTR